MGETGHTDERRDLVNYEVAAQMLIEEREKRGRFMASIDQSRLALEASRDTDWREEDVTTVYLEVCKAYHNIDDFRSKLLGLLPLVSGTSIFFLLKDAFTNSTKVTLSPSSLVQAGTNSSRALWPSFGFTPRARLECICAWLYLVPIGIFGFIVTLGLFFYELHGIRRCIGLIVLGKRIEGLMGIGGQFWHRPPDFADKVGPKLASIVIYPAVLGSWAYVALFTWPLLAQVGAPLVFLIGLVGSWLLPWKAKPELEPNRQFRIAKYKTLRELDEEKDSC